MRKLNEIKEMLGELPADVAGEIYGKVIELEDELVSDKLAGDLTPDFMVGYIYESKGKRFRPVERLENGSWEGVVVYDKDPLRLPLYAKINGDSINKWRLAGRAVYPLSCLMEVNDE